MQKPVASIFITTYNRADILKTVSLPSALNQTFKEPFEVLVVDDCSPDNGETERVVAEFQKKHSNVRYVRHKENKAISGARHTGVQESRGDFIVPLDDDDAFDVTFLEKTVPVLRALPPEYGAVYSARLIDFGEKNLVYACPNAAASFYMAVDDGWVMRRSVFDKIHYDEFMITDEDAHFGIQFFQHFKAHAIKEPLLYKQAHPIKASQKTGFFSFTFPSEKRLKGLRRFVDRHESTFRQLGSNSDRAFFYRFAGRTFCWGGCMQEGRPFLLKAMKIRPSPRNIANYLASLLGATPYRWYWCFEANTLRKIRSLLRRG